METCKLPVQGGVVAVAPGLAKNRHGNHDDVVFKPNLDFMAAELTADDVLKYAQAKNAGAPLSLESIHEVYRRSGITSMTFEDEQAVIEDEDPTGVVPTAGSVEDLANNGLPASDGNSGEGGDEDLDPTSQGEIDEDEVGD